MMKQIPLTHFYMWGLIRNELIANIMQEFADNGAERLVFNEKLGIRLVTDDTFAEVFLDAQKESGSRSLNVMVRMRESMTSMKRKPVNR